MTDIHSCSYYCNRPGCIKAQRDELRDSHGAGNQVPPCADPSAQPASGIDAERLIAACLPGGHSCDPQAVADAIRQYCTQPAPAQEPAQRLTDAQREELLTRFYPAPQQRNFLAAVEAAIAATQKAQP